MVLCMKLISYKRGYALAISSLGILDAVKESALYGVRVHLSLCGPSIST
jgi:hypothetical protein